MSLPEHDLIDASLGTDAQFDDALRRVNFAPGMLLGIEATRAEQDYHRRRHTRHAYWLHGSGTVVGLRVDMEPTQHSNNTEHTPLRLTVRPGIGVDGLGREISVHEPYCIDLRAWLSAQHGDESLWGALVRDGFDEPTSTLWLAVTMRYQDCPSGLQPGLATEVNAGTDPVITSRVRDCVLYELVAERPAPAGHFHPFASHNALAPFADVQARLSNTERARVNASAGGTRAQMELGARLLHALGDDNHALEPRQSATLTSAELARTLLARVSVSLSAAGDLIVNPNLIKVDNLARAFVLNASTLAHLQRT